MESLKRSIWESWRETSEIGSQFLWRGNLEGEMMSESQAINLTIFILRLRVNISMMSHATVILSHNHMPQWIIVEGSKKELILLLFDTC